MATPKEIRDGVDSRLAALWPTMQARQTTYASSHGGRFFQGRRSHNTVPDGESNAAADALTDKPTDQAENWNDASMAVPASLGARLTFDVYKAPAGWGYVATVFVRIVSLGRTFRRSQNVGPETWRTQPWQEV